MRDDVESPGELLHNLIANDEFRLRFADRVQALMHNGGALTEAAAQAVVSSPAQRDRSGDHRRIGPLGR